MSVSTANSHAFRVQGWEVYMMPPLCCKPASIFTLNKFLIMAGVAAINKRYPQSQ